MEIISKEPSNSEIVARWIIEECDTPIAEVKWILRHAFEEEGMYGEYDSVIDNYYDRNKDVLPNERNIKGE